MLGPRGLVATCASSMGEALSKISTSSYDLILVDIPPKLDDTLDLMRALRQSSNRSSPVVFCSECHHESSSELKMIMKNFSVETFIPRPFDMFEAPQSLIEASKRRVKPAVAAEKKVIRGALRSIVKIWKERLTGVLRIEGRDDWAVICGGGPTEPHGLLLISEALHCNTINFTASDLGGTGDHKGLSGLLWNSAMSLIGEHHYLRLATSGVYSSDDLFDSNLPFSSDTLKLISTSKGDTRFETMCRDMGLNIASVAREIGALSILSMVDFKELGPEEFTVSRPRVQRSKRQTSDLPVDSVQKTKAKQEPKIKKDAPSKILTFLLADLERLKGEDSFTILGISPKCTQAVAEQAGSRMIKRYQDILREDINTETRVAAQKMLTMVTGAAATVAKARQGVSEQPDTVDISKMTTEERAFAEGKKAFNNRDYNLARKCFKRARDERLDSVDNLAWLGWAVYHNTEMDKEDRVKEAFDMLRLASSFNPHHEDGQYFLAYVEGHHGLIKQALQRLTGLLGDNPNNESAKSLAREYRRLLKQ